MSNQKSYTLGPTKPRVAQKKGKKEGENVQINTPRIKNNGSFNDSLWSVIVNPFDKISF